MLYIDIMHKEIRFKIACIACYGNALLLGVTCALLGHGKTLFFGVDSLDGWIL